MRFNQNKLGSVLLVFAALFFSACNSGDGFTAFEKDQQRNTTSVVAQHTPSPTAIWNAEATEGAEAVETVAHMGGDAVNIGDDYPVSRGFVAKMLALTFYDGNTITSMDWNLPFSDTQGGQWYDIYVNAVYAAKFMSGTEEGFFLPEQAITLAQAQILLDKMDPNNKVKVKLEEADKDKPISYALWIELYTKCLENMSGEKSIQEAFNIEEKVFVVMATPGNNRLLEGWNMITDQGPRTFTGLNMEPYVDQSIRVLQKEGELIAVLSVENLTPVIQNAYVVSADAEGYIIFSGGAERQYLCDNAQKTLEGKICDITIEDGRCLAIRPYEEQITGIIQRTDQEEIELSLLGNIPVDEHFKIYSLAEGAVKWKYLYDLLIGTDMADFILKDGKICAAVIRKMPLAEKIRVALHTTGYQGLYHDRVSLTCTTDYKVYAGLTEKQYAAGELCEVNDQLFDGQNWLKVQPSEDGLIQITSIQRNWDGKISPKYRGLIEVGKRPDGYVVVNEIDMESYLWAVVPSEMPSGYGVETSKVQAVTARSYAYNQFFANRYHSYGANVDDSVSCQVYNNIPENPVSIEAVNATKGQCITYDGAVISANFFSTSSGVTANSGEVWADSKTKQFAAWTPEYLKSVKQYEGEDYGDLSMEENAARFLKDQSVNGFDSKFPWFRWQVEMTSKEIGASINANLKSRYGANPQLIKTLQPDGAYRSTEIDSIGDFVDMEVVSRGAGGNIMSMKVVGTQATILILTEYNIRVLMKPFQYLEGGRNIVVKRKDGSESVNYSIMPSAYFVFDSIKNAQGVTASYSFYGGGNGHGVGMSQNGAKGMIDAGYSFEEILTHFYSGSKLETVY